MLYDWYFYENAYTNKECDEILKIAKNAPLGKGIDKYNPDLKNVSSSVISTQFFANSLEIFFSLAIETNQRIFGYKIFDNVPPLINLNVYSPGQEYKFHIDSPGKGFACDTKLTAILNLSEDTFTGGELEIFAGKPVVINEIKQRGSILIFPSFLYHRVTPVLSGTRITLSCWFNGPNWR